MKTRCKVKVIIAIILCVFITAAPVTMLQAGGLKKGEPFPFSKYPGRDILVHSGMYTELEHEGYTRGQAFYIDVFDPSAPYDFGSNAVSQAEQTGNVWIGYINGKKTWDAFDPVQPKGTEDSVNKRYSLNSDFALVGTSTLGSRDYDPDFLENDIKKQEEYYKNKLSTYAYSNIEMQEYNGGKMIVAEGWDVYVEDDDPVFDRYKKGQIHEKKRNYIYYREIPTLEKRMYERMTFSVYANLWSDDGPLEKNMDTWEANCAFKDQFFNVDMTVDWYDDYKDTAEEAKKREEEREAQKKDVVVDTEATKETGEQDGGIIEGGIVDGWKNVKDGLGVIGGIAGGVAAVGGALALNGNGEDAEEKKKYRMVIYKEFGDLIRRGETVTVYACIMESDGKGPEHVNMELTRMIRIFSPDQVFDVQEHPGTVGQYKGADVCVGADTNADVNEGIINFYFEGKGGSYTNRMKFRIEDAKIIFYQENMALPAGHKEHVPVQFTLEGFDLNTAEITVETSEGSSYEAEYVPSENAPGTYFAIITDMDKSKQDAGTVAESMLYVTVKDSKFILTEGLKLLRVNEGLNVSLDALNCYREILDSAANKQVHELTKEDLVPATTTAKVILVLYNEEEHTIDQLPVKPEFTLEPIDTDPVVKRRVDELGIEAKLTKVEEGYSEMTFFCTKAYLEPPCRFRIKVKASCFYEEKKYEWEKEVLMRSQPVRSFQSKAAESAGAAQDKEIERKLEWMLTVISRNNWEEELAGEIMVARLMLDNYEWWYGYDALQAYEVLENFYNVHAREHRKHLEEQYKAMKEADPEKDDFYHELEYRTRFLDSWGGIAVRIGLAIGTGGWSEAAFLTLDVNRAVVNYNDATPKEKRTTWGQVKAGAVPVAIWVAFAGAGKVASKVVPKVGAYVSNKIACSKSMSPTVKNAAKKVAEYFGKGAENAKNCEPQKLAQRAAQAEKAMTSAAVHGEMEAKAMLQGMSKDLNALEKLMEAAQKAGDKEGAVLLKEIKLAVDTYRVSGKAAMTEGALKQNIVKLCQNKFAIEQLIKENPGQANVYRRLLTSYRNKFLYDPIKKDSCKYIADMLGCDPKKITIKSVSGNNAEALNSGKVFGHDLDVTFLYENSKGELVELAQPIAEEALYKTTCRHAGIEFKSLSDARKVAEKLQIHACQPSDAERLPEVQKFIEKALRNQALESESVGKFVNAESYKSLTPYRTGMSQIQKAAPDAKAAEKLLKQLNDFQAGKGTLSAEAQAVIEGVGNVKEGFRSFSKGCNLLKNKAIGADTIGGRTGLSQSFHTADGVAKEIATGNVSVAQGNKLFNTMGGFETSANQCFNEMGQVNTILQKGASAGPGINHAAVSGAMGNTLGTGDL